MHSSQRVEEKMEAEDEGRERHTASFWRKQLNMEASNYSRRSDGDNGSSGVHRPSALEARGRASIVDAA